MATKCKDVDLSISDGYEEFLKSKRLVVRPQGKSINADGISDVLFPFQRDLVKWAARKGRCAIFADTGLGKTLMQIEWARLMGKRCLIVAPLSVARQTVREAAKLGEEVLYVRAQNDTKKSGIYITNYEMIHHFDAARFDAVVLDESSILKSLDGKTRKMLTSMFAGVDYRLCCTATPAPNDIAEIANHAEFLGIMSRVDMLSAFFVHDSMNKINAGWRLKGHAAEPFYRWLASWGMSLRFPSDLGYEDDGFVLPPLAIEPMFVESHYAPDDQLFFTDLKGIGDRAKVRRATVGAKVEGLANLVNGNRDQWIVWCGLNDESKLATKAIPDAVEVKGSDSMDSKIRSLESFQDGEIRVLVTKTKIAGFGMNFQNCHRMAFLGLSDSWESYYQAIRRCYRFGQKKPVEAWIILADIEKPIFANINRKERQANAMRARLVEHVQNYEREEILSPEIGEFTYATDETTGHGWTMHLGDSAEKLREMDESSVGLSVFSPPFMSLYTYSPTERDLGNSGTPEEFFEHFRFIIAELLRVTEPGRNCCVHCAQVPATKLYDGYIGVKDFRGDLIREFDKQGWIYYGEVCIDKDPQAQAIRTKAKSLLFVTLNKDSADLRPALADYILIFKKPGDNDSPITPVANGEMDNETWISWARPIWYNVRETETLNFRIARADKDERHICPLQLDTIERCVKLWSNPGDLVLDPFAGIGSTGFVAVRNDRAFTGIELKPEYYAHAIDNLNEAARQLCQVGLFAEENDDDLSEDRSGDRASTPEVPSIP